MDQPFVLVVEDDFFIRELIVDVLADAGMSVRSAASAAEAFELMRTGGGGLEALVTDINLGRGPSGWEVARRVRDRVADAPVVYLTADRGHEWASQRVAGSQLLGKPFTPAKLLEVVRRALR